MAHRLLALILAAAAILALPACKKGATLTGGLKADHSYHIFVKRIAVSPQKADGEPWDTDNGAPDITYTIKWQGIEIHKSATVDDALEADFDPVNAGLIDGARDRIGAGTSNTIEAPIIRYSGVDTETIHISVYDADALSRDDAIAELPVKLSELDLGDNVISPETGLVTRLVVRVVDASIDVADIKKKLREPAQ